MALTTSPQINFKTTKQRRYRQNERRLFYHRRNIAAPLSPEAEDRLNLTPGDTYVKETIAGNTIILTFYRKDITIEGREGA